MSAVAVIAAVTGGVIAGGGSAIWATVLCEVAIAVIVIAAGAAVGWLVSDWRHRGHDDAEHYSRGEDAHLGATSARGLTDPLVARVERAGHTISDLTVHEPPDADEAVVAAILDDRPLWLEAVLETTPGSGGLRLTGSREADGPRASYSTKGDVEQWQLSLTHRAITLESPRRRRPDRRTLRDPASGEAFLVHRMANGRGLTSTLAATVPSSFTRLDLVFVLWLVHLLDVRADVGTDGWWVPRDGRWWPVPASLGFRLGPGGFGDRFVSSAS